MDDRKSHDFRYEPGDYNTDGVVDILDYVTWRMTDDSEFGYDYWRSHFGNSDDDAAASAVATPEPSAGLLGIGPLLFLLQRRRR